jgi:peptide-methionine (S)-S-oxide reductase
MPEMNDNQQRAIFAAGCFWGVEASFRAFDGVLDARVGYTGGTVPNPTYEQVCGHGTGHAEAIEITFDPRRISYEQLLAAFWRMHDPTAPNRQGWDFGDQYRSAIFVADDRQRQAALASRDREQASLARPIVTEISDAGPFYSAEDYHQRYFERSGAGCGVLIELPSSGAVAVHECRRDGSHAEGPALLRRVNSLRRHMAPAAGAAPSGLGAAGS